MKRALGVVLILSSLLLSSCGQQGVQGTSLYSSFQGLTAAEPLSPTAIKLSWNLDSSYSEYRIYENDSVNPIQKETFSTSIVTGLNPEMDYAFMVSGYSTATSEKFLGGKTTTKTFGRFPGLNTGGITLSSATEIKLTWDKVYPKVKYKVYQKEQGQVWNFAAPVGIVTGANQYSISSLTAGKTYCFYVVAEYLDSTSEPTTSSSAAADALAPCQQLTSPMVGLPSVSVSSVIPGGFPWFWASNGNPTYRIEVYELDSNVRIASRIGNGTFRAFQSTPQGRKNYYALVTGGTNVSRVAVNIVGGSTPTAVSLRGLNEAGSRGPLFPPVLASGRGQQNLGNSVASGDFNCDGYPDVAVAAETATPFSTDRHYSSIGSVVIYYSWQPPSYIDGNGNTVTPAMELKSSVAPSANAVYPNPLLITYPVTQDQARFGRKLAVGNFNGDCYFNNPGASTKDSCNNLYNSKSTVVEIAKIKSCDDLAVTSAAGYFYTIYGDPIYGLVAGSQSNTAGVDETTCDMASNTCRTSRYSVPANYNSTTFGNAITTGDYNNDGYDDIALSAFRTGTNLYEVLVYRGSGQGIVPNGHSKSHAGVVATAIPISQIDNTAILPTDGFGLSLGTAYNSRSCINGTPGGYIFRSPQPARKKGYDLTKCDDLVIGMPGRNAGRGSIVSCKAEMSFPSADIPKIASWNCQEHFPNVAALAALSPPVTVTGYGSSILGVPNQNGYPLASNVGASAPSNALPDIAGALFVGAPTSSLNGASNTGTVFGYYMTPHSANFSLGGIQGILGNSSSGHDVTAQNSVPCNMLNANVTSGSLQHCENQLIYPSPSSGGAQFGYAMASIPDRVSGSDPWMPLLAISAPFRTTTDPSGNAVSATGTIYLFRGDISTFGMEGATLITAPKYYFDNILNTGCTTNCTWLSGGISPFGPTVIYPSGLTADANFGIGGSAGGSFNGDDFADIVSTAPGQNLPSSANGGMYAFYSSQGSFSPSVSKPDVTISQNNSLEGNYRFEEAKVIGDVNGDGYKDIATHINNNGVWVMAVYYGSAGGLVTTSPPSYTPSGNQAILFKSLQDIGIGRNFYAAGDINGDGFDDIFAIGNSASYIFYGSSSGIIANVEPDIAPIGKNPLRFALTGTESIMFHSANALEYGSPLYTTPEFNPIVQAVANGRFNDDIYSDLAIRIYSSAINPPASIVPSGMSMTGANIGRVVVIYGGNNGPETDRVTGRIRFKNGASAADVLVENPCNPSSVPVCKVQVIASSEVGSSFGFALATRRGLNTSTSDQFDGLLVSDPRVDADAGAVYVYQGGIRGLAPLPIQKLTPRDLGGMFGYSVVEPGDINKDFYSDVIISSGKSGSSILTAFYGAKIGGQNAYFGGGSLGSTNYWAAPVVLNNTQHSVAAAPRPQVLMPSTYASQDYLGRGLTAVGDFNADGYADFAVNVPNGDFTLSGTILQTGYVIIYYGGELGVQTSGALVSPYPRCFAGASPICEPFQIYLPNATAYEFTTINPQSAGDINGDGLPDLIIGGFGRNHPTGQAISTGVIYVLY